MGLYGWGEMMYMPERVSENDLCDGPNGHRGLLDREDLGLAKSEGDSSITCSSVREKMLLIDRLAGSVHAVIDPDASFNERQPME